MLAEKLRRAQIYRDRGHASPQVARETVLHLARQTIRDLRDRYSGGK